MPSTTTPNASNADARDYSNYAWVPGKKARYDSFCLYTPPDDRVYLGIKGWDSRHKAPGFIMIEVTATGLQDMATLANKAIGANLDAQARAMQPPAGAS